jgi:hypothetical protein
MTNTERMIGKLLREFADIYHGVVEKLNQDIQ